MGSNDESTEVEKHWLDFVAMKKFKYIERLWEC